MKHDDADLAVRLAHSQADVLQLFTDLEALISAARSSPDQQQAIVELVDALTAKRRALTEDEELIVDGLLGVEEAASFLGIGETLVRNMIASGELRFVKLGTRTLLPKRLLLKFAADRLSEPRTKVREVRR